MYKVVKTFGNELGLSAVFRQWRATHSHCQYLHGYALGFEFTFASETLDERNWVIDFGAFQKIKKMLVETFDHKLVVALDDPWLSHLRALEWVESKEGGFTRIANVLVLPSVGCEAFAKRVFEESEKILNCTDDGDYDDDEDDREAAEICKSTNVRLESVACFEHGANRAIYYGEQK